MAPEPIVLDLLAEGTAPDPTALGSDILLGPLALAAFIFAALGYAAREYRKAREARVEDLVADVDRLEEEVDAANARTDQRNAEIIRLKEEHMQVHGTLFARFVRAREMLIDRGVSPEELP